MSCNFLFCFSHSHSHFARVLGEVGRMPRRSRNYCVIIPVIDHRSSRGRRSESRPFDRHIQGRHAAHRPSSLQAAARTLVLSCEFDPDLFVKLVRRWLVGCWRCRAMLPVQACSNSLRQLQVSSGRRWGAIIVDLSSTLRSTESFHSTKLSTTSRQISRGPHIHTDKHPPARPV
jgi:hypothetical protein